MDKKLLNLPLPKPKDLESEYRAVEADFYQNLQNPKHCFEIWNSFYQKVKKKQPKDKRFHKGGEFHNMGISKLLDQSPIESLHFFIMGFIEDVLSQSDESGNGPESAPGAQNLKNIFELRDEHFKLIRTIIQKEITDVGVIQNPQVILTKLSSYKQNDEIEQAAKSFSPNIIPNSKDISNIPGNWSKRVFIGGDYSNIYILNRLIPLVINIGYEPILAAEFKREGMSIHQHALLLLHNCKYAIFDISTRGGHFMEIERAVYDYQIKTVFVCQEDSLSSVSAMLGDIKSKTFGFKNLDELDGFIKQVIENAFS